MKMHHNAAFLEIKFQNFLGRGYAASSDSPPVGRGTPRRLWRLALDALGISTWPPPLRIHKIYAPGYYSE